MKPMNHYIPRQWVQTFKYFALTSLLLISGISRATPSRVEAIDGGNSLVADDWDVSYFDNLAPYFANHVYVWYLPDNTMFGWGIYEIRPAGTFTIWINRPAGMAPLFQAAGDPEHFGRSSGSILDQSGGGPAWAPREQRIGIPENLVALGWGRGIGNGMSAGFTFQYARNYEKESNSIRNESGSSAFSSGSPSLASYILDSRPGSATVVDFVNSQSGGSIVLGPSFGCNFGNIVFDASANVALNSIKNTHTETFTTAAGDSTAGEITQTLQDTAPPSYGGKARMMIHVSEEDTLVIQGELALQDLSTQHRVKGVFGSADPVTGAGNWNHVDQKEKLTVLPWTTAVGITHKVEDYLVLVGLGANGRTTSANDLLSVPKNPATPDDIGPSTRTKETETELAFPLIMGVEYAPTGWLQLRTVAQRNIWGSISYKTVSSSYDPSSGARIMEQTDADTSNMVKDWIVRAGTGLHSEGIGWDTYIDLVPEPGEHYTLRHLAIDTTVSFRF